MNDQDQFASDFFFSYGFCQQLQGDLLNILVLLAYLSGPQDGAVAENIVGIPDELLNAVG